MEEQVNHPKHYNQYPIEVIDMMVSIWGVDKVVDFCMINAFKYRMGLGHKGNMEQDMEKEQWYLKKAQELKENRDTKNQSDVREASDRDDIR